jgi:hypothetical protein
LRPWGDQAERGKLTFEDWIAEATNTGVYAKVAVVEYSDEDEVVAECLVVD